MAFLPISKRIWWPVSAILFWLLTLNLGRLVYLRLDNVTVKAASGQPYTVIRTEAGYDKVGNLVYTNEYIEALRRDGSTMRKHTTSVVQQRTLVFANGDEIKSNEVIRKRVLTAKDTQPRP